MDRTVAFARPDGSVGYLRWLTEPLLTDETEDEYLKRMALMAVPVVLDEPAGGYPAGTEIDARAADALGATYTRLPWQIVSTADIPIDRTFRNGWKLEAGVVSHDMAKCRNIHRDRIREARKPALADLDGQWMRAMGRGDTVAAAVIETKRETWRKAPADPAIDSAITIDDLKAIALPR